MEENGDVSVKITVYHRQAMDGYYVHPWRYNIMERAISVDMYDNNSGNMSGTVLQLMNWIMIRRKGQQGFRKWLRRSLKDTLYNADKIS